MNLTKNTFLKTKIQERLKELEHTQSFLINDASERGMMIKPERLSRYLNGKPGGITEDQLIWVATRLGIFINLNFGKLTLEEGKATFIIGRYNEGEVLAKLKLLFPKPENKELEVMSPEKTINKRKL